MSVTTTEERAEALYVRKRYEEALFLINNSYAKPMQAKVQSGYFNYLLATGQTGKAQLLMVDYFGNDRDKWIHWLTKIMQKKQLEHFLDLVPSEKSSENKLPGAPRQATLLPTSFYTKMFLHFIKR